MNENKIEIALMKLRKVWKQTKTQSGKQRIEFAAKVLKQGISGALIPLTMNQKTSEACDPYLMEYERSQEQESLDSEVSGIQYFTPDFIRILNGSVSQ